MVTEGEAGPAVHAMGVGFGDGVGVGVGVGLGVGVGVGELLTVMEIVCLMMVPALSLAWTVKRCVPAARAMEVSSVPPGEVSTALPST